MVAQQSGTETPPTSSEVGPFDIDDDLSDLLQDRYLESQQYQTSLHILYGKPGVPEEDEAKKLMAMKVGDTEPQHPVKVLRDHLLPYPDLGLDVFIPGDKYEEAMFAPMFARADCRRAKSVIEADLVVFTGGSDVDPQLYGERAHHSTHFDTKRDSEDMMLYAMCLEHGIPMVGVCRGAQFGWVMNGGKLFQDVDKHYGDHAMYDMDGKRTINQISSVHHQMCAPTEGLDAHIIGVSSKSSQRVGPNPIITNTMRNSDIEAYFIRETCFFGVQGHPEYSGYQVYTQWFLEKIDELVCHNPDVVWDTSSKPPRRRLDPTIIAKNNAKLIKGAA